MNSYDFLKFLTVKLSAASISCNDCCTATGFFLIMKGTPVIVTAKHFAENTTELLTIPVHYKENNVIVTILVTAKIEWMCSDEYDIAYCKLKPIDEKFKRITGREMFYTAISDKDIISKEELSEINILSEVLTIGYPNSIASTHHEFPLFKKGYISSYPRDFEEDCMGYLDLCAEKGCSGSPIFLNNTQLKLLGVVVKCVAEDIKEPKNTTVYITANKLLEIKDN